MRLMSYQTQKGFNHNPDQNEEDQTPPWERVCVCLCFQVIEEIEEMMQESPDPEDDESPSQSDLSMLSQDLHGLRRSGSNTSYEDREYSTVFCGAQGVIYGPTPNNTKRLLLCFSTTLLHSSAFSHSAAVCKLPRLFNEV